MKKRNRSVPVIFVFISLCLFTFSILIGQSSAQIKKDVGRTNGWREIEFNFGTLKPPYFQFHPSGRQLVLEGGGGKGIRLLGMESGGIQELTKDIRHKYVSISCNGSYIFFTDSSNRSYNNLYVYDVETKKISNIYSLNKPLPIQIINDPLSPSGKYLIGPGDWEKQIILPGGEEVTVIPIHGTVEIGKPPEYFQSRWSFQGDKLFLINSKGKILSIRDAITNKQTDIRLKMESFIDAKPSPDNNNIYIYALPFKKKSVNLYLMRLRNLGEVPKMFIEDVFGFDVDGNGNIVFSRIYEEGFERLYVYGRDNKMTLIKEYRLSAWPMNPRVSKDGKAIAFFRKIKEDQKVITVLIRNDR